MGYLRRYEWLIGTRYLRSGHRRGFLSFITAISVLGLMLGVAVLVVVMSVMNGFEQELRSRILAVTSHAALESFRVTLTISVLVTVLDVVFGLATAWVLVRDDFAGKGVIDALIDLPFALPTAVAGLVYSSLYVKTGWFGQFLVPLGIQGSYSQTAIVLVLTFIGLPFVVRSVQPVLQELEVEIEEAAACLGASRLQTFTRVIVPSIFPAIVTGFALSFARGLTPSTASGAEITVQLPVHVENQLLLVGRQPGLAHAARTQPLLYPRQIGQVLAGDKAQLQGIGDLLDDGARARHARRVGPGGADLEGAAVGICGVRQGAVEHRAACLQQHQDVGEQVGHPAPAAYDLR